MYCSALSIFKAILQGARQLQLGGHGSIVDAHEVIQRDERDARAAVYERHDGYFSPTRLDNFVLSFLYFKDLLLFDFIVLQPSLIFVTPFIDPCCMAIQTFNCFEGTAQPRISSCRPFHVPTL
jgi:hypothetical protein